MSVMPAATASSTANWMSGLSTIGIISLGLALVAGRKRVPRPATGNTALVIFIGGQLRLSGSGRNSLRVLRVPCRVLLPAPYIGAHVVDSILRAPAQQLVGERRIGKILGQIAGPPAGDAIGHVAAARAAECVDHFEHAIAAARSEIDR